MRGAVVFNLVEGSDVSGGIANLREAFQSVEVFLPKGPGNTIVVGIPAGPMPGDEDLRARARTTSTRTERATSCFRACSASGFADSVVGDSGDDRASETRIE